MGQRWGGINGSIYPWGGTRGKLEPDMDGAIEQFSAHRASMGLDQFLDDGQTDAGSAVLPRARLFPPVKTLKYKGKISFGNFPNGIAENNLDPSWLEFS